MAAAAIPVLFDPVLDAIARAPLVRALTPEQRAALAPLLGVLDPDLIAGAK